MKRLVSSITILAILLVGLNFIELSVADIPTVVFYGYYYSGLDSYYGVSVIAYLPNSYGAVIVHVRNDLFEDINLTSLRLVFEWGGRFLAAGLPDTIPRLTTKTYIIEFRAPTLTRNVTNTRPYTYYIEADVVIVRTGEFRVWRYVPTNYFVILSDDQRSYYDYRFRFSRLASQYPTTWFTSIDAVSLVSSAYIERDYAEFFYTKGNFTEAARRYRLALELYDKAVNAETQYRSIYEKLRLNRDTLELNRSLIELEYMLSQINSSRVLTNVELMKVNISKIQADAELIKAKAELMKAEAEKIRAEAQLMLAKESKYYAYALSLFGIGFIIISIGVLIYLSKRKH